MSRERSKPVPPPAENECERLASLRACRVLDSPAEAEFDDLAHLAARLCETPIALVSLVDADRQWFKARVGLGATETPRDQAFCGWAIGGDDLFVVEETHGDDRFRDHPLVTGEPWIRFYAGAPLRLADGTCPGTLCVIDTRPRGLREEQRLSLLALARQASAQMELRRKVHELEQMAAERDRDAAELRRMRDRAEAASAAKSEFLANMSHEIRTPMTAILGYTDLLLDDGLEAQVRADHVDVIKRNGKHLLAIINDVLDLSKLEAGRIETERIGFSPAQVVADVIALLRPRAEERGITLTHEFRRPIPREVRSDPTRLRQILVNLVGNAVKFTEVGGVRVTVDYEGEGAEAPVLRFEIADTGIGMTAEQQARLFRPFAQADSSTTREYGGSGLGLVISRRYAHLLGGELTVRSAPGEGSTFTVTMAPEVSEGAGVVRTPGEWAALASREAAERRDGPSASLEGRSILLVEDGPDNQRLIAHHLRRAGAAVETARNGVVAVAAVEAALREDRRIDLILMDMQMPEMDGYEATRAIRRLGPPVPIVALTAHAMSGDRERCLEAGCDDYLTKPIDRAALIGACAAAMRPVETQAA